MCVCVCQGVRHTSSNGGAKDLVHMRVFELEGAMLRIKSRMACTIWGGGQFAGTTIMHKIYEKNSSFHVK